MSVLSLVLAALVFVLSIRDVLWPSSQVKSLGMISAVDRFKHTAKEETDQVQPQISALVQQAQAFALYLNPPRALQQVSNPAPVPSPSLSQVQAKAASSSPKFELHGISYHRSKPAESMALVCEPGSGRRWVRQGAQLGHVIIEKITSTSIVCRDGEHTREIAFASSQALAKYAKDHSEKMAPKLLPEVDLRKPISPPMRGIRQMPAAYATAKMGLQLAQVEAPSDSTADSK